MQIRLTVLAPRGGRITGPARDVVVTAPAGTVLSAVLDGLVAAAAGAAGPEGADRERAHEPVPVYAGRERLDPHRQLLGSPPLIDGAEVSLHAPSPHPHPRAHGPARARLQVISGPDAGGVHLLQGGRVSVGRSAEADVPLSDPDVSRLHCAVTVTDSGELTVTDLGSTNGTRIDGLPVEQGRAVPLPPGATLYVGESAVRVDNETSRPQDVPLSTTPDGEGHLRIAPPGEAAAGPRPGAAEADPQTAAPPPPGHARQDEAPVPGGESGPSSDTTSGRADAEAPFPTHGDAPKDGTHPRPRQPRQDTVFGSGPADLTRTHPGTGRRPRALGDWARRLTSRRDDRHPDATSPHRAPGAARSGGGPADDPRRPDPATVLLTALGPGPRLWERGPDHADALTVRLGSAHRNDGPGAPVTVDLGATGSLGLAGPRPRLHALARSLLAQLAALHPPGALELVLLSADPSRELAARVEDWGWLGWLPHVRPLHGQDCRLLLAYEAEQAAARAAELTRRLEAVAGGAPPGAVHRGPRTVLVVDGDPGTAAVRESVTRLAGEGRAAGIHVLCLADAPAATPASPVDATVRAARRASAPFVACATYALLSGAVATAVRTVRPGRHHADGEVASMDGVSAAWAERFARALAPLREADPSPRTLPGVSLPGAATAPPASRLLDELGLARATPASVLARWTAPAAGPGVAFTAGAGPRGPVTGVLGAERRHLRITGERGAGKTELLRTLAASLAADTRPDQLALVLVDGDGGALRDGGLGACADLPHVAAHLVADDPGRMRDFAQALTAELKQRAELYGERSPFEGARVVSPRRPPDAGVPGTAGTAGTSGTAARALVGAWPPRRMAVLVDDFDALVDPALGNPGRPSAGSVVRALEAVARDGARLGVHLLTASGSADRTDGTEATRGAAYHVHLTGRDGDDPLPGRGTLRFPDGTSTVLQAGRVTGRIPRTSTTRPTVVPLDWARAGDPPTRRPVRELGNGPTDLALLASAMERAARTLGDTAASTSGVRSAAAQRAPREGAPAQRVTAPRSGSRRGGDV